MQLRISLVSQFEQQQAETWALAFASDGKRLVSSDGNALYLWQLDETGNWDYERALPFRKATFPHFAPDGTMLAFGSPEPSIKLISLDGEEVATFPCPAHASWAFSPDQRWLVSTSSKREILLWDLVTYQSSSIALSFPAFARWKTKEDLSNERVGCFLFTPDGQQLVFGASSSQGYIHLCFFDPEHRRITQHTTFPVEGMLAGSISPDGKKLAMVIAHEQDAAYQQEVSVYDLASLQLLQVFPQVADDRYCLLAFSPDSQYLASCKDDGWVDLFSLVSFERVAQFAAHPGLSSHATDPIGGFDWSSTGYLATGGASVFAQDMKRVDSTIKLWKIREEYGGSSL